MNKYKESQLALLGLAAYSQLFNHLPKAREDREKEIQRRREVIKMGGLTVVLAEYLDVPRWQLREESLAALDKLIDLGYINGKFSSDIFEEQPTIKSIIDFIKEEMYS